jgi:hypothetical protein
MSLQDSQKVRVIRIATAYTESYILELPIICESEYVVLVLHTLNLQFRRNNVNNLLHLDGKTRLI